MAVAGLRPIAVVARTGGLRIWFLMEAGAWSVVTVAKTNLPNIVQDVRVVLVAVAVENF